MDKYYLPKNLDEPFRIYMLTIGELLSLILPVLFIGLVLDQLVLGSLLGIGLVVAIKRVKSEQGQNFILNLMYWYLPSNFYLEATPPSHIRHYIG